MKKTQKTNAPKADVYQIITDRICSLLEQGVCPWKKSWHAPGGASLEPQNFRSKKTYRGINYFLLSCMGYEAPFWLSFKQAQELGGNVRKGEKGTPVVFWNWLEKANTESGKKERIPFLRYYTVFNIQQTEGIAWEMPSKVRSPDFSPITEAQRLADAMPKKPTLKHGGNRAFYAPAQDSVTMPEGGFFVNPESYYSVLFHELTHATGHESRLARKALGDWSQFGSHSYGVEELVAEMGAAFLCAFSGISNATINQSAAYLDNWLRAIKEDRKLVVTAAAQAQKAADFILGVKWGEAETEQAA